MKITLKHIAEDTGYSISTISRVLSGSDKIGSTTREKVINSAKKLGYNLPRGNGVFQSKKYVNVALIATGFHEGEFYSCYFHGLNKAASHNKVRLFLKVVLDHEKGLPKFLKQLSADYYDGFVLFIPELDRMHYEAIAASIPADFPVISNSLIENPVFPTVTFDSYSGGFLAAKHFHERGYKKLGIICGPENRSESRFRKNGFADYISQQPDMELIWVAKGNYTFKAGEKAFKHFHSVSEKPEAIFTSNDAMANGFLQSAKKFGYKIPDDVALIGYDDLPANNYIYPKISSIHTDYEKLGNATFKALLETISKTDLNSNLLSFVPVSVSHKESS